MLKLKQVLPPPQSLEWPQLVTVDVDSTLWPFDEIAPSEVGIRPELFRLTYNFRENPNLTGEQISDLLELFEKAEFFEKMELFPGASEITRIEELGMKVAINSNCSAADVIPVKRRKLLEQIPGLDPSLIFLTDLAGGRDRPKNLDSNTLILIEDSPYNVAASTAKVNILRKIPWNQSVEAKRIMHEKLVFSFDTIEEINEYIYTGIREWLKTYNFTPPLSISNPTF